MDGGLLFASGKATSAEEDEAALRRMVEALPDEVLSGLTDDAGQVALERIPGPLLPVAMAAESEERALVGQLLAVFGADSPEALIAALNELRSVPTRGALQRLAAAQPDTEEGRVLAEALTRVAKLAQDAGAARPLPEKVASSLAQWERFQSAGSAGDPADLDGAIVDFEAALMDLSGELSNALAARYLNMGRRKDLDAAIAHAEAAVRLTSGAPGQKPRYLNNLAVHLSERFRLTASRADLDAAFAHAEEALRLTPEGHGDRPMYLDNLANRLSERFALTGLRADLDAAIAHAEAAVRLTPAGHGGRPARLNNLANHLSERFRLARSRADLDAAFAHTEEALRLTPEEHGDRPTLLSNLASRLSERFSLMGSRADLDAAIAHAEAAVGLTPEGHGNRPSALNNFATHLAERFRLTGSRADLDAAVAQAEAALQLTPEGYGNRPGHLNTLANVLSERFVLTGSRADLAAAIAYAEAAVRLTPEGHGARWLYLSTLAIRLAERFRLTAARADLDAAVAHAEAALRLIPEGHEQKAALLNNLGAYQFERFALTNSGADLASAIAHTKTAVLLTPEGHVLRPSRLTNLSNQLTERYRLTAAQADLDEAIAIAEAAVCLTPEGHSERPSFLNNLAKQRAERFHLAGSREDLDAAIAHAEAAVHLTPGRHELRLSRLSNLAAFLSERFALTGTRDDLDAAIAYAEAAVHITADGHGERPIYLNNLATHLSERFALTGSQADLVAAIAHAEAAVRLTPEGHHDRPGYLNNLAIRLSERFRLTRSQADLDAAIANAEAAVRLTADGHGDRPGQLNNLAAHLAERFHLAGSRADLDAAIGHAKSAVRLTADGHGQRPMHFNNLATHLLERFALTGSRADLDAAIANAEAAVLGWQRLALESEDGRMIAARSAAGARRLLGLLMNAGNSARLVRALEVAKAVRLRADLAGSGRAPAHLDAAGQLRYQDVRAELPRLRGNLRAMDALPTTARAPTYAADVARMRARENELSAERTRLEAGDPAFSAPPLDFAGVRHRTAETGEAVVYLQPLDGDPDRLLALIVHPNSPADGPAPEDVFEVPRLGRRGVQELLLGQSDRFLEALEASETFVPGDGAALGWLIADWAAKLDRHNVAPRRRWLDTMSAAVTRLGGDLMTPIARRLAALAVDRVVLIPGEGLGLFPLHAGPIDADGTAFGEVFETRYAPSATALSFAARPVQSRRLVGIANPDGSLAFSDLEMRHAARLFHPASSIRHGPAARRDWLLAEAGSGDILALSTHARFAMGRPELSYFVLAHPDGLQVAPHSTRGARDALQGECEKLSLDDILRGELRLTPGTLVVADACETGQIELGDGTEEFVGFPAAFLASGASAVIASLWSVADFSTALLMEEVYRRIKADEPAASALQKAAQWLRRLSCGELRPRLEAELARAKGLREELRERRKSMSHAEKDADDSYLEAVRTVDALLNALRNLDWVPEHPFEHPYHWAPFALHGSSHAMTANTSPDPRNSTATVPATRPTLTSRLARFFK
jgi:CHAT domain-containing protein